MVKINTDKFIEKLKNRLTDVNTGSYVADDCGEDYFEDALNLNEIIDNSTTLCTQFNEGKIDYDELLNKLCNIEIEWDTSPFAGFHPFKKDTEPLGDTLYEFSDFLDKYLEK